MTDNRIHAMRDSQQDARLAEKVPDTPQTRSPAYRLAFTDSDFMTREETRSVRLQLELMKPDLIQDARGIRSTVVVMGSARIPDPERNSDGHLIETAEGPVPLCDLRPVDSLTRWYGEARKFSRLMTEESLRHYGREYVVVTGGGPGIMEAGNRGAMEAGGHSIGLNIVLPHEQAPNAYVTPDLCFNFHYFAIRKMHFLLRARAICIFPGGFGTLDEMFESLTLIQTGRMAKIPFLLFGKGFWEKVINWKALEEAGVISPGDLDLFQFVETAEEAIEIITGHSATPAAPL